MGTATADPVSPSVATPAVDKARIILILDRSGSMTLVKDEAEKGVAHFLAEQAKVGGKCKVSFTRFDTEIELVFSDVPIDEVPPIKCEPRNMTALLDAVGKTISEAKMKPKWKTYVVIVTDGQENSSREWTLDKLRPLIEERRKAGWEILFIGTSEDAVADARQFGVATHSSATMDVGNSVIAYAATSENVTRSRMTGTAAEYTDEEKAAMATPTGSPD